MGINEYSNDNSKMTNTQGSDLETLIDQVLEDPKSFYIAIAEVLSIEERLEIWESLSGKRCDNCHHFSCTIPYLERSTLDENGKPLGENCSAWYNFELAGRSKVLGKTSINQLKTIHPFK